MTDETKNHQLEDNLLNDFFSLVDQEAKKQKKPKNQNPKNQNLLKPYKLPLDNPILKLPRRPQKVVLHWTETVCRCGYTCTRPTYGHPAMVHWPHLTKRGVVDILPLRDYQVIPDDIPIVEEWQKETISCCPQCFTGQKAQLELFAQRVVSITQTQAEHHTELPSEDIRDYLDDPNIIALEEFYTKGEEQ